MTPWNEQSARGFAFFRRWWRWIVTLGAALLITLGLALSHHAEDTRPLEAAMPEPPASVLPRRMPEEPAPASPAPPEAAPQEIPQSGDEPLIQRIETLEERVRALESREASSPPAALYPALYRLRVRLERGERAQDVLAQLAALPMNPQQQALFTELTAEERAGVDSTAALKERFSMLADARAASGEENNAIMRWLTSRITIRKIGDEHGGNDDASIIARAEAKMSAGDAEAAIKELRHATETTQRYFEPWRERAERRQKALRALDAFERTLAARP